jgi:ADP-ribose pyrophosphatase
MAYEVLQSETIFQGKVFGVRIDQVKSPAGKSMRVDLVEHGGAVALIPVDDQQRFWFVRQYRHPTGEILLEIPAGTLELGEDPVSCAIRECREEIGMSPGQLTPLGGAFLAPGYSTEFIHFFMAEDLTPASLTPDEDEELHVEQFTWEEIQERITRKEVRDAKTLAGLFLARTHLQDPLS